jgi:transcription termination/antitermination protein NusG
MTDDTNDQQEEEVVEDSAEEEVADVEEVSNVEEVPAEEEAQEEAERAESPDEQEVEVDAEPEADEESDTDEESETDEEPEAEHEKEVEANQADDSDEGDESIVGRWYVVHTQSGFEAKAKEALEQRIQTLGFEDKIFEIIVPMRDVVVIKKGKKTQKKEKVFPGYILVRMILDNDSWIVVRTTQGITGFVGAGTKPTPISSKEVQAIMKFVKQEQPKFKAKFSVGEAVKVTDGPFSDFVGSISNIDEDKGKVTVLVSIFGRETPVELDFLQINKL